MCMKWIGGPNPNLKVWLVPRVNVTHSSRALSHTGRGGIFMTIHSI